MTARLVVAFVRPPLGVFLRLLRGIVLGVIHTENTTQSIRNFRLVHDLNKSQNRVCVVRKKSTGNSFTESLFCGQEWSAS